MMMKHYFDYIEERLNWLSLRITSRGALNMYDINIHCEYFYMHLLNLLYGWDLINANTEQRNIPAVDLIYKAKNIIVQVSSTNTSNKIQASLNKLGLEYKGYNFKFVSIAKPVDKLKEHRFILPADLDIIFNPVNDIFDINVLLTKIASLTAVEQKEVYEFIKQELHFDTEELKLETGLANVINELSYVDLRSNEVEFDTKTFDVDKKIIRNDLSIFKEVIEQYDVYYTTVQKIYDNYDEMGNNKSLAVLHTINKEYLILNLKYSGDALYKAIAENIKNKLTLSANLKYFNDDDLELYVDIILVDAFIRCKIFEKP